jgi:hypothetical protein
MQIKRLRTAAQALKKKGLVGASSEPAGSSVFSMFVHKFGGVARYSSDSALGVESRTKATSISTAFQMKMMERYGDCLFLDTTFVKKISGPKATLLHVVDCNYKGIPCWAAVSEHISVETLKPLLLGTFSEVNRRRVKCIFIDCDMTEVAIIQSVFPCAKILWCMFHVYNAFHERIRDKARGNSEHELDLQHLDDLFSECQYVETKDAFDVAFGALLEYAEPVQWVFQYVKEWWGGHADLWAGYIYVNTPYTAGQRTNNFSEGRHSAWNTATRFKHVKTKDELCVAVAELLKILETEYCINQCQLYSSGNWEGKRRQIAQFRLVPAIERAVEYDGSICCGCAFSIGHPDLLCRHIIRKKLVEHGLLDLVETLDDEAAWKWLNALDDFEIGERWTIHNADVVVSGGVPQGCHFSRWEYQDLLNSNATMYVDDNDVDVAVNGDRAMELADCDGGFDGGFDEVGAQTAVRATRKAEVRDIKDLRRTYTSVSNILTEFSGKLFCHGQQSRHVPLSEQELAMGALVRKFEKEVEEAMKPF